MPATDCQGSASSLSEIGRLNLTFGREVIHSMDGNRESSSSQEIELESFQNLISGKFHVLASMESDDFLSLSWIRCLLDAFLICQDEFRVILLHNREIISKPPMDRLMSEFSERSVKALDVCNAIRGGIEQIHLWLKHLEIVLCALDSKQRSLGEGHFRRAKKALVDLTIGMLDERESGSILSQRNRSFGRVTTIRDSRHSSHFRSLSWNVSRSWSAARQLQAIGNNVTPPRGHEIVATNGLAVVIYTMNSVLLFVMWALVAALPCQDRGLHIHFSIPRHFLWSAPIMTLHERIVEESRKRDRRGSNGLLKEIHQIEVCARQMTELVDTVQFPMSEEKELETKKGIQDLTVVFNAMKNGLDPLEQQVRGVFHKIVRSRTEGLDYLSR